MNATDTQGSIAALSRVGKQPQAIAAANAALAVPTLGKAERVALLDLRAEALIAEGRFDDAARDAEAMLALAGSARALKVMALTRQALVLMRRSDNKGALTVAEQAEALAVRANDAALHRHSLLCLAEAQLRAVRLDTALATAERAAKLFEAAGDTVHLGRAHWIMAFAHTRRSDNEASRRAAQRALELARQCGDGYGLANALNVLSFSCQDVAERLALLQQAAMAFERAGHVYGRMLVVGNLSLTFGELGLWRRACRLGEQCIAWAEAMGAGLNQALEAGVVLSWRLQLGERAEVRARWPAYDALVSALDEPLTHSDRAQWRVALALAEGDVDGALQQLRKRLREVRVANPGFELYVLIPLARTLLLKRQAAAALRATRRGIDLLRERGFARTGFGQSQDIWWWHSRALAALGRADEAWAALQQAHGLMLVAVRNLRDEGLRRSYLNKLQVNRELVPAWLAEAARRGVPVAQRLEHLRLPSSLADPFKRLVESGLRLNQLRSESELHDFLIDELTELSGAERVLLVLQGVDGRHVAGALLPAGEDAAALLQAVTPWLDDAAATREPRLRHGPAGAAQENQRSCLVAPLVAQGELLGHVYADIEGAFGRFGEADRDLLAMLAGQAAVALANLRFAGGLEAQVAERTLQARSAQAEAEQRAAELAIVNAVQQALAGKLNIQGVYDAVGDKLREVFASTNVGIRILDAQTGLLHYVYQTSIVPGSDSGSERVEVPPEAPSGFGAHVLATGRALLVNESMSEVMRTHGSTLVTPLAAGLPKSQLTVPLRSGGQVRGVVSLGDMRREHAFGEADVRLLETLAASMSVALDNARLFDQTQEALARQTATAEILRGISNSPTDPAPVFDAVAERARLLCGALVGFTTLADGESLHLVGFHGVSPEGEAAMRAVFPVRKGAGSINGRCFQSGTPVQIADVGSEPGYQLNHVARVVGYRSALAVPVLEDGQVIGTLGVLREQTGEFPAPMLSLLQTFADQAAIAIRNARLFNETQEALERQTATADILRVISHSPDDIQPVFHAIVGTAFRLIKNEGTFLLMREGDGFRAMSIARPGRPVAGPGDELIALDEKANFPSQVILAGTMLHLPDWQAIELPPQEQRVQAGDGIRSSLMLPIMHGDECIGVLSVARREPGVFSAKHISLLRAFVDQAVIAISNVRLFKQTQEALERQTATAEVLQVIGKSVADVKPVFDRILESCRRLFDPVYIGINLLRPDGLIDLEAFFGPREAEFRSLYPVCLDEHSGTGLVIRQRDAVHFADAQADDGVPASVRRGSELMGSRSVVFAPLMWQDRGVGSIFVGRSTVSPFSQHEISLIKTFADQAVIAIQNARLFNETQEALAHQTASADILRVISSSPTDVQPVFEAIVGSGRRLLNCTLATVLRTDGQTFQQVAVLKADGSRMRTVGRLRPVDPDHDFPSQVIVSKTALHLPDWTAIELPAHEAEVFAELGCHASLMLPLMRAGACIGVLGLLRTDAGPFSKQEIALARSFCDHAVIAIENVRLFNETQEALEQQTATSEVLGVLSSSVSDAAPVFDKILESCEQLFSCSLFNLLLVNEAGLLEMTRMRFTAAGRAQLGEETVAAIEASVPTVYPMPVTETSAELAFREGKVVEFCDALNDPAMPASGRLAAQRAGHNYASLSAPLIWEGHGIGILVAMRFRVGSFRPKEHALLKTFADQAVIAIQNARMFNETQEALAHQTASADILRVISSSPTDVQPVFEAIVGTAVKHLGCDLALVQTVSGDTYSPQAMATPAGLTPVPGAQVMPVDPAANFPSRAIRSKTMLHVSDWSVVELPPHEQVRHQQLGLNSALYLPLVRGDDCVGVLVLGSKQANAFNPKAVALAESFRDQALIAVENVRLFNETREALEQQKASSDVLEVISRSMGDSEPVFEAILERCERLIDDTLATTISLVEDDGLSHLRHFRVTEAGGQKTLSSPAEAEAAAQRIRAVPPAPAAAIRQSFVEAGDRIIVYADVLNGPGVPERIREYARAGTGGRVSYALATVPMFKNGRFLGTIGVARGRLGDFDARERKLLEMFARQAVVALENARLFRETNEALERQTATAEILAVISESPTDVQPVFQAIAERARTLCEADVGATTRLDGDVVHLAGVRALSTQAEDAMRGAFPMAVDAAPPNIRRAITEQQPIQIADVHC